jgi:hypothetical protein
MSGQVYCPPQACASALTFVSRVPLTSMTHLAWPEAQGFGRAISQFQLRKHLLMDETLQSIQWPNQFYGQIESLPSSPSPSGLEAKCNPGR